MTQVVQSNGNTTPESASSNASPIPPTADATRQPQTGADGFKYVNDPSLSAAIAVQTSALQKMQELEDERWKIVKWTLIGGAIVVTLCAVGAGGYYIYKHITLT